MSTLQRAAPAMSSPIDTPEGDGLIQIQVRYVAVRGTGVHDAHHTVLPVSMFEH